MPCRPASHDYREHDGVVSREELVKWLTERKTTHALLLAWATEPGVKFVAAVQARVSAVLDQPIDEAIERCPSSVGIDARERVGEWAMTMAFRAQREETALCEARCVLAHVARLAGPPPPSLATRVDAQLSLHRAHRFGDRQAARAAIEGELARIGARVPNANADKRAADLREKLRAIEQLSDDELLEQRASLKRLWP